MKPNIVIADGFDKSLFEELCNIEQFDVHPEAKITQEKLKELLPNATALVIRSATTVTPDLLEMAPNLKYVIRAGEGTDNIDKVACAQKNVAVSNTPGANNNSAAEHAVALTMTVLRKTAWAHGTMAGGGWDKSKYAGTELANKKVGVVGFGRIGQIFAKRIGGFDPELLFFDPFVEKSDLPYAKKADSLEQIFKECEIISLHTPLMDATRGMVNRSLLESMREDAILINASRGGIVDEEALLDVLSNKKIKGAGFDVYATEPLEENSPLRELDNLVMTPHLGASTGEAQVRVGQMVINQLKEYLLNDNLLNEVKA